MELTTVTRMASSWVCCSEDKMGSYLDWKKALMMVNLREEELD